MDTMEIQSPEWLAMMAYAVLVGAYITSGLTFRSLSTITGYTLLFLSKYHKTKHAMERAKQLQALGYAAVLAGLSFHHWRDAFSVVGYTLAIADVSGADTLLALILALSARDTHVLPLLIARIALVVYLI